MSTGHSLEDLFAIELDTHLKTLVDGIGALQSGVNTPETLTKMFRAAHSLKGAARLVQNHTVEAEAHKLEEELKKIEGATVVPAHELASIVSFIERLGGRVDSKVNSASPCATVGSSGALLHINSQHIAELIQLASELAVITKRLDSTFTQNMTLSCGKSRQDEMHQDTQRAAAAAVALQRLSYRLRLTPLHELTSGLPIIAESLAQQLHKNVVIRVLNGGTLIDRDLLRRIEPCFIQLLKNAIDHGIETPESRIRLGKSPIAAITMTAKQYGATVEIEFRDDGQGIDTEAIRAKVIERGLHDVAAAATLTTPELFEFLFLPGFSTRGAVNELSGRGVGLDIVKATLRELGGDVTVKSQRGVGTTFSMRIPSRIASFRALLFKCGDCHVGVPLSFVDRILTTTECQTEEVCGATMLRYDSVEAPLVEGHKALRLPMDPDSKVVPAVRPIVVLAAAGKRIGFLVDALEGEQEVIIHPLDRRYTSLQNVLGIAGGVGGRIVTIINPEHLLAEPLEKLAGSTRAVSTSDGEPTKPRALIVDDSLTVRELERRILEQAGFDCTVAIDGVDGASKLQEGSYSIIITDIDMPRMDGFGLIQEIRANEKFNKMPILVVSYKEREEDRQRGIALGANGYLSKGSFKDASFISTVTSLIEEACP